MIRKLVSIVVLFIAMISPLNAQQQTDSPLEEITVQASSTANTDPVGTFGTPASNLEYDPRVDLQSRNMAEAQADVTVRGGIFENTGFSLGSATLFDPQTGHYVAEIPVSPQMLSEPQLQTGIENALYGFNSSVATIGYDWGKIEDVGELSLALGNHGFGLFNAYIGKTIDIPSGFGGTLGFDIDYASSQSDGTIANGDHDFERISARIQLRNNHSKTDLFIGKQEKFFGWPNLYTPFDVNETEDLKTRLFLINHSYEYGRNSDLEVTAYKRSHEDQYTFSREMPSIFQAKHKTDVAAIAFSGRHVVNESFALNYGGQYTADEIESSNLEQNFTSRNYYKLSVLPEISRNLSNGDKLAFSLGGSVDDSNRNDSDLSLLSSLDWEIASNNNIYRKAYFSYAETTQLSGYTAIGGSESQGLFRSNRSLGRETTKNMEIGYEVVSGYWNFDSAVFYRQDNALTDWTYSLASTSARSANPVDIDTTGLEVVGKRRFDHLEVIASYTYLSKLEDYGVADVDASFYALNYPDHRITLAVLWRPLEALELRVDNEWRAHEENILRESDDEALFTHFTIQYSPKNRPDFAVTLAADNLWKESFEEIPGTPGRGRQVSLGVSYSW